MLSIASRIHHHETKMPYTVTCAPLGLILLHKFIWYRSIIKPFKTPQHVVKYLTDVMLIALIVNFSIREDGYAHLDAIVHFWPCYGLISITFVFFAAGILVFISTACSYFTGDEDNDSSPSYI